MTLHQDAKKAWEQIIELQGLIQAAELVACYTDGTAHQRGALIAVLSVAERAVKELNVRLEKIEEVAKRSVGVEVKLTPDVGQS